MVTPKVLKSLVSYTLTVAGRNNCLTTLLLCRKKSNDLCKYFPGKHKCDSST